MLTGAVTAFLCWEASPGLLVWMSPVLLGLVLSGPINWFTAQPAGPAMSVILSTPVDRAPASILLRALRHTGLWRERLAKVSQIATSPDPATPELKAA
jgi:membrane glycosyltransferase